MLAKRLDAGHIVILYKGGMDSYCAVNVAPGTLAESIVQSAIDAVLRIPRDSGDGKCAICGETYEEEHYCVTLLDSEDPKPFENMAGVYDTDEFEPIKAIFQLSEQIAAT